MSSAALFWWVDDKTVWRKGCPSFSVSFICVFLRFCLKLFSVTGHRISDVSVLWNSPGALWTGAPRDGVYGENSAVSCLGPLYLSPVPFGWQRSFKCMFLWFQWDVVVPSESWPVHLGAKAKAAMANVYSGRVAPHSPHPLYPTAFKNQGQRRIWTGTGRGGREHSGLSFGKTLSKLKLILYLKFFLK